MSLPRKAIRFTAPSLALLACAAPAYAKGGGPGADKVLMGMVAGPAVLLLCLAALCVVYVAAAGIRKQDGLVTLTHLAAERLSIGRAAYTLWGILAELLLLSAFAILSRSPQFGLVVIIIMLTALALAGLGAGVAAYAAGRRLHAELAGGEIDAIRALGIGLRLFFVAVALPFAGWLIIALAASTGIGAVLVSLVQGEPDQEIH